MKELYYIGEVAEILNISTQTLRYYDKIGILQPAYTDPNTGYRMYTYQQVSYADRIRYLQNLGLNLNEIRGALQNNDIAQLVHALDDKKAQVQKELKGLQSALDDLQWYSDYYNYNQRFDTFRQLPFISHEKDRYILVEPLRVDDAPHGPAGHRLMRRKNSNAFRQLSYLRQHGFLLDYNKLLDSVFEPSHYWILLRDKPQFESKYIRKIPAGTFFCIHAKFHSSSPPPGEILRNYFSPQDKPPLVIAPQYETNFLDFKECPHEIQILIESDKTE